MRHSGKTTLLIDLAVQELFTKGEIFLLRKSAISKASTILPKTATLLIDPDHRMGNQAQNDFLYRFLKRLEFEHKGSHKIKKMAVDYIHVTTIV